MDSRHNLSSAESSIASSPTRISTPPTTPTTTHRTAATPPPPLTPSTRKANQAAAAAAAAASTTTNFAALAAVAAAMDLKAKAAGGAGEQQKIKKLVRRNASDKMKLIQMVHDNPILWDSRLPNFKGAEEEKTRAWEQIGKEFNVPGRRVARAFKSLRESYRRELAHVKLMGNGFKPKWSLFEAMDFLRDVIRERKGGAHAADQTALGLNLSAFAHISSNNNNNNNNNNTSKSKLSPALAGLHSSAFADAALNLSKCASLLSNEDYYYYVKPEMDLSHGGLGGGGGGGALAGAHPLPAHHHSLHGPQQQQQQQHGGAAQHQQQSNGQQQSPQNAAHDSRVSSTRNDNNSTQNTTYDDLDASSLRSGDDHSIRNAPLSHQGSDEVEELDAIDADFPYPLILDGSSRASGSAVGGIGGGAGGGGIGMNGMGGGACKRRRKDAMDNLSDAGMDGGDDEDDEYEGQMLQQHRALRQQNGGLGPMMDVMLPPLTVREVLNSKFCGFISAKLNSMASTEADSLMTKILMLLVQTQTNNAAGPAVGGENK